MMIRPNDVSFPGVYSAAGAEFWPEARQEYGGGGGLVSLSVSSSILMSTWHDPPPSQLPIPQPAHSEKFSLIFISTIYVKILQNCMFTLMLLNTQLISVRITSVDQRPVRYRIHMHWGRFAL